MSFNYNHITLVGRLTGDPDRKKVGENCKTTFSLKVDRPYRKNDGSIEADYISVILWGKLAEIAHKFLKKDYPVLVEGRIQVREYEHNNERKWVTEVVAENFQLLEKK